MIAEKVDAYIPDGFEPFSDPTSKLYYEAQADLLGGTPSIRLKRFPLLSESIGGLRAHEYTILCGATGTGKTTLCANISADLIEQKIPHFVASVETGAKDYINRVCSVFAGTPLIDGEQVNVEQLRAFNDRYGEHMMGDSMYLSKYEDRVHHHELLATLAWHYKYKGCKVAILDNLNFFTEFNKSTDINLVMDKVTHDFVVFCKRVPMHIIMIMHPKKTVDGFIWDEADIKGSLTSAQEATGIFFWNRPCPYALENGIANEDDRELMIGKMRRKGKYVRSRIIFKSSDTTSYFEGERFRPRARDTKRN